MNDIHMARREELLLLAKMALETERFRDLREIIHEMASGDYDLSLQERGILSSAFKLMVGSNRAELRVLGAVRLQHEKKHDMEGIRVLERYQEIIEAETRQKCLEILRLLEERLLPNVKTIEGKVFFLKMKGDYLRYLCEFLQDQELEETIREAKRIYYQGENYARNNLTATSPVRLGLMLNLSVLYHEIEGRPERAL